MQRLEEILWCLAFTCSLSHLNYQSGRLMCFLFKQRSEFQKLSLFLLTISIRLSFGETWSFNLSRSLLFSLIFAHFSFFNSWLNIIICLFWKLLVFSLYCSYFYVLLGCQLQATLLVAMLISPSLKHGSMGLSFHSATSCQNAESQVHKVKLYQLPFLSMWFDSHLNLFAAFVNSSSDTSIIFLLHSLLTDYLIANRW